MTDPSSETEKRALIHDSFTALESAMHIAYLRCDTQLHVGRSPIISDFSTPCIRLFLLEQE